jgi:hypothetical protein
MRVHQPAESDSTPDVETARDVMPQAPPTQPRWVAPAALVIALIAMGVAAWALMQSPTQPAVDAQQSDAAKGRVCAAFDIVRQAVSMQTNADMGTDPVARQAVAANARLATLGGGEYLLSRVDPATPADLADAVRTFANDIQDIGMNQLVGIPNADPRVTALLGTAQSASERITQMCT